MQSEVQRMRSPPERESASSPSHGAGSRLARGAEKQITKPQNEIPGQADTDRAEAFSDGVLAIVITLLVFELKPPQGEPGHLLSGLLAQWPVYLAYVTLSLRGGDLAQSQGDL